jgi:hypothetical protein
VQALPLNLPLRISGSIAEVCAECATKLMIGVPASTSHGAPPVVRARSRAVREHSREPDEARQMIEGLPLDPAADGTVPHCRFASMLRRRLGRGGSAQSAWVSPSVASANGEPLSPFRMFWRASKKYQRPIE